MASTNGRSGENSAAAAVSSGRGTRTASRVKRDQVWEQFVPAPTGVSRYTDAKRISLALIDPNPEQPRRGELPDIPVLAAHIKAHGLLQPIVVTASASAPGRFVLIAGARRLAAFRLLFNEEQERASQWADIPAVERDADAMQRLLLALAENMSRHNLSDADALLALITLRDKYQWGPTEIARRVGTTPQWISQQFKVAADPTLAEYVDRGQLSIAKAQEIRTATSEDNRTAALVAALDGAPKRAIRALARRRDKAEADGADDGGSTAGEGAGARQDRTAQQGPSGTSGTRTVATAALDAGVRDLAELAASLGLSVKAGELQLTRFFRAMLEARTDEIDAAALLRAMRSDQRRIEAVIRAAQVRPHQR